MIVARQTAAQASERWEGPGRGAGRQEKTDTSTSTSNAEPACLTTATLQC